MDDFIFLVSVILVPILFVGVAVFFGIKVNNKNKLQKQRFVEQVGFEVSDEFKSEIDYSFDLFRFYQDEKFFFDVMKKDGCLLASFRTQAEQYSATYYVFQKKVSISSNFKINSANFFSRIFRGLFGSYIGFKNSPIFEKRFSVYSKDKLFKNWFGLSKVKRLERVFNFYDCEVKDGVFCSYCFVGDVEKLKGFFESCKEVAEILEN